MAETTKSKGFFEMLWDCEFCDTKGLLAKSQRHCPECGGKQDASKRYFPKEGEEVRVDGHKYEGADRHCGSCNAAISSRAKNCTNCGASTDGSTAVRRAGAAPAPAPKPRRRWWILVVVLVVIALAIVLIWYRFLRTKEATLTVAAHHWERAVAIEEYGERPAASWRDAMPRDASGVSCTRKQRSTKKIPDGETCTDTKQDRGDGTFEVVSKCKPKFRSEPVDDDWCSYKVRGWHPVAPVKRAGTGLSPAWPTQDLPPADTTATFGARRSGKRTENLILEFTDQQRCDEVDEATWKKYADGAKIKMKVKASSGSVVCSSL